jgi:hypothetical protein
MTMSDESIFADQQTTAPEGATTEATTQSVDQAATLLQSITNQDGKQKYDTVDAALTGLANAQEHIAKLEQENAQAREALNEAASVKELLAELKQKPNDEVTTQQVGLKAEDIQGMTLQAIEQYETQKQQAANAAVVDAEMKKRYGDNASKVFDQKVKELGVDGNFMYELALKSPAGFMAQFNESRPGTSTLQTSVNTSALESNMTEKPLTAPKDIGYGTSAEELRDFWRQVKDEVNAKYS